MRYLASSTAKDVRRYRLFEKALDALATSPYARGVTRWIFAGGPMNRAHPCTVLLTALCWVSAQTQPMRPAPACAGLGNGARIATVVASRCRGSIVGLTLLSYPLLEPLPPAKTSKASKLDPASAAHPNSVRALVGCCSSVPAGFAAPSLHLAGIMRSHVMLASVQEGPLLKIQAPVLFICGSQDPMCPSTALADLRQRLDCPSEALVLDVSPSASYDHISVLRSFHSPLRVGGTATWRESLAHTHIFRVHACWQGLDASLVLPSEGSEPSDGTVERVWGAVMHFVQARNSEESPLAPPAALPEEAGASGDDGAANGGACADEEGAHQAAESMDEGPDTVVQTDIATMAAAAAIDVHRSVGVGSDPGSMESIAEHQE
jgi:hypothetical protein